MNGTELRAWREELGFNQTELARQLGTHNETVSRWERGTREVPPFLPLALETLARRRLQTLADRVERSQEVT